VAVYVVAEPECAFAEASRETEGESRPMVRDSTRLADDVTPECRPDVKTAVRRGDEAGNDVWHVAVTVCPVGAIDTSAQPLIALPPFSNVSVPDGSALLSVVVTVANNVTGWFVTAEVDEAVNPVVVGVGPMGGGAVTTAVGDELAVDEPARLVAVSCTTMA
jgi:hypothetical protein